MNRNDQIVIVGNGVMAKVLTFYLNRSGFKNITRIAEDTDIPMCSTRTTAINCLRGTQRGLSPLGDLIVDSFDQFEKFYHKFAPEGVSSSYEIQSWPKGSVDHDKWLRRFKSCQTTGQFSFLKKELHQTFHYYKSDAYIFDPEIFYEWLDANTTFELINDRVIAVEEQKVKTLNGQEFSYKHLYLCTSYMSDQFASLVVNEKLKRTLLHSKPVAGSYLSFPIHLFESAEIDLSEPFSFVIDEIHFIVRPGSGDVLLGATTENQSLSFVPNEKGLQEQYDRFCDYVGGALSMPEFTQAKQICGIRHKGQRRTPVWGQVAPGVSAVWGLYKNAFTLAFLASEDLVGQLESP